jgi:zinc transporter ZupT
VPRKLAVGMTALGLSCFAFVSTVLGGFFGLRAAGRMPELIAFSGGVMFGVVGFDILPELFEFSKQVDRSANIAMAGIVYGFIAFDLFKRLVGKYFHGKNVVDRGNAVVGATSATALIGHSVADGIGIGLGFQVSPTVGLAIAIAVIGHDFCDGLNTVGVMLTYGNRRAHAVGMLALDALAPIAGVLLISQIKVPPFWLFIYLGLFGGVILHVATSLFGQPEKQSVAPSVRRFLIATTGASASLLIVTLGS